MRWFGVLAAACMFLALTGCGKTPDPPVEEDGGKNHYTDTEAPKVIESAQIVSFSCTFSTMDIAEEDSPIAGKIFTLTFEGGKGGYAVRSRESVYLDRSFSADPAFFEALQQIVSKYDLAQYNGTFCSVAGLPPDYGADLTILYASGERIHAFDNESCFLPIQAMEELADLFEEIS